MSKLSRIFIVFLMLCIFNHQDLFSQSLKKSYEGIFDIGVAVGVREANGTDTKVFPILDKHFNSLTPENLMKWGSIHPRLGQYNFEPMDRLVALAEKIDARVIGHTLVWHNQTPDWVYEDENGERLSKDALLQRMEEHIEAVAGRYKGKVFGYDVVNEAFFDDGQYRTSKWYETAGKDFIKRAFIKTHEVDPDAELYYNDYNMWKPEKTDAAIKLAKELREEGIRIDGIGMQGHYGLDSPSLEIIETAINKIADAGFKVMFTEVDIDVLPNPVNRHGADIDATFPADESYNIYKEGLPDEIQAKLVSRYKELFELFKKHEEKITRITFWGVHDGGSWLNNWPMPGRTAYPLIIDKDYKEKKDIIDALIQIAEN